MQWRTTVSRTSLDEWSARHRDLYLTTHNTHNRRRSMPPVGFEPTIASGERLRPCGHWGWRTQIYLLKMWRTLLLIKYCNIILYENFFQYRDRRYKQTDGCIHLPSSHKYACSTTSVDILVQQKILGLHQVDDILIIYDKISTDMDNVPQAWNSIHPTVIFSKEEEFNNPLSSLDIKVRKKWSSENLQQMTALSPALLVII